MDRLNIGAGLCDKKKVGDCNQDRAGHCHLALCRIKVRATGRIFAMLADKLPPDAEINKS
jgi:hypothetical protein